MLGKIVADRRDRMGSRLMVLANVFRISQDYDLPCAIYWSDNDNTSPELRSPDTLFSKKFIEKYFLPKDEWLPRVKDATSLTPPYSGLSSVDDLRKRLQAGEYFLCGNPFAIIALPWENPEENKVKFKTILDKISFSSAVTKHMQTIQATLKGNSNIAYHLRRGDIINRQSLADRAWPGKYVPTVFYESIIEAELDQSPNANIVVFSDTQQELKNLRRRFPILTFEDIVKADELNSGQRDFLELYMMSQCDKISAPKQSGFSNIAIEFGRGEKVSIPEDINHSQKVEVYEELVRRLEKEPEYFLNHADLGQSIFHAVSYLQSLGDIKRASKLLEKHIRSGVSIAYLYSLLADCKLSLKQNAELSNLHKDVFSKRTSMPHKEWGKIHLQAAIAEFRLGNVANSRALAINGFWHAPNDTSVNQVIGFFIDNDILTTDNFFPFDPLLHTHISPKRTVFRSLAQHLTNRHGAKISVFNGDLLTRDWNGRMTMRLHRNHDVIEGIQKKLEQLQSCLERAPDLDVCLISAMSVYHRFTNEVELSVALAETAFDETSENALYAKRLGDALDAAKDKKNALSYARKAVDLSNGNPCYLVALAQRHYKYRQKVRGAEIIEQALKRANEINFIYPDLLHTYFIIMREIENPDELFGKITRNIRLASPNYY